MATQPTQQTQKTRRRGAQPGNQNARTHGFYSRALTPRQREALQEAAAVNGLDQEIALLRLKIDTILANDPDNHRVFIEATSLLARLLQTKALVFKRDGSADLQRWAQAYGNILSGLMMPMLNKTEYPEPSSPEEETILNYAKERDISESFTNNQSRSNFSPPR